MVSCRIRRVHVARFVCSAVLLVVWVSPARAQDSPPPYLAVVEGAASIDRQGDVQPAVANMPLVPGDRVSTLRGRAEILFPDGSALDLDEYSGVDLVTPIRISVVTGRVIFVVPRDSERQYATRYEIDTPGNIIVTNGFGTYRADASSASTAWPADVFDEWAQARYGDRTAAASQQYLPADLRVYGGTLDRSGEWQYDASYGYVWYPSVASGWRPYYSGYWEPIQPYGWTWIGAEAWAWPTHHYGRWGHARSRWFWIPGRTFGPAWVSWGAADGYVSWCPLGFDNRPVFAFSLGLSYPSDGWVVVPRTHFGTRGVFVSRYAVAAHHLSPRAAFVTQSVAPVALPRDGHRRASAGGSANPPSLSSEHGSRRIGAGGLAVPRNTVAGQSQPVTAPGPAPVTQTPSPGAQPQYTVPVIRRPQLQNPANPRDDAPRVIGRVPGERRVMGDPTVVQPAPGAVPRAQPPSPEARELPRFRSPSTINGAPREGAAPGYATPRPSPRLMPPTGVAPQSPAPASVEGPRFRSPATPATMYGSPRESAAPGYTAPQAAPRWTPSAASAPASPVVGVPAAPPHVAPAAPPPGIAVPRAMPALPAAAPPAAAPSRAAPAAPPPPPAAAPTHAAPSRSGTGSGGGESRGDGHARRRG
jgi:hypothetical protein